MLFSRLRPILSQNLLKNFETVRHKTYTRSGGILPEPPITKFGLLGVICTVIPGLLIGATISKNMASFLEENDLFVPSDDDDDDD
ncbi:essential MCU regulator, mitochondrial-like [Onthophagus taurus]|uniref:essential MCU regulator, mitochondrial-like n=1 Tax=Onthophagus taurus TaxID=166361 RepID=UPI0039BE8125